MGTKIAFVKCKTFAYGKRIISQMGKLGISTHRISVQSVALAFFGAVNFPSFMAESEHMHKSERVRGRSI